MTARNLFVGIRRQLLCGSALAIAPLISTVPAAAQSACPPASIATCLGVDQQKVLQSFANLPFSPQGKSLLDADLAKVESIYFSGTAAQRAQALINAQTGPISAPQANLWGMISNLPASHYPLNASSFTGIFPTISQSAALATILQPAISSSTQPVYSNISNVVGYLWPSSVEQITYLKYAFTSYNDYFVQQRGLINSTWGGTITSPNNIDLRPYQVSNAIGNNPWSRELTKRKGQWPENMTAPAFMSGHSALGNTAAVLWSFLMPQAYQSLMVSAQQFGLSRNLLGVHYPTDIIGGRVLAYYTLTQMLAGTPLYAQAWNQSGISSSSFIDYVAGLKSDLSKQLGPALTAVPYANCAGTNLGGCIAAGTFPTAAQFTEGNNAYAQQATYGLPSVGPTNLTPVVPQNAWLLLATRFPYLSASQITDILASTELPSGGVLDDNSGWVRLNLYAAAGGYGALSSNVVVTQTASKGGFHAMDVWSNNIGGRGSLTLQGTGTLLLAGDNTYTGGTFVGCSTGSCSPTLGLSGTMIGDLTIYRNATFVSGGGYKVLPNATLENAGVFESAKGPLENYGSLNNLGTLKAGLANSGSATNDGSIKGDVKNSGFFGGSGSIGGRLVNTGVLSVSASDSMSVDGNFKSSGGFIAQVEGKDSSLSVGGRASLQGGVVSVQATPEAYYAPRSTYTLLSAAGGLTGTFVGVTDPYPFLQSSLSYDATKAYVTLSMGGFANAAATPTQAAVGAVLDANVGQATGDFAQVLSATAFNTTSISQGQATLTALSGNNYAGFATGMVQGAQLFMNNFSGQGGGGGSATATRVALADACDVTCDATDLARWGAWGGALGGLGTMGANQPLGSVTYNAGGFAAGLDRTFADGFRAGVTVGYSHGTQWVSGFSGQGTTDTVQFGLYGNYAAGPVYADALFGYAYSANQMTRQIAIPGLAQRTAVGQTGANQFFGQLEAGYRIELGTPANAYVTPFARLQGYTGTQNAFTETGAQSLNLSVAQQTTNSLRSVLGAQLGTALDLGWREKLALQFRLGWSHEYGDVSRPVTAALAGAPGAPFTTFGISPTRDGVLLGFGANTAVAEATSLYLRYEGTIAGQDSSHALTAGLRMTW